MKKYVLFFAVMLLGACSGKVHVIDDLPANVNISTQEGLSQSDLAVDFFLVDHSIDELSDPEEIRITDRTHADVGTYRLSFNRLRTGEDQVLGEGDLVTLRVWDKENESIFFEGVFPYGADLLNAEPLEVSQESGTWSEILAYVEEDENENYGFLAEGSAISFRKQEWAQDHGFLGSDARNLTWEIVIAEEVIAATMAVRHIIMLDNNARSSSEDITTMDLPVSQSVPYQDFSQATFYTPSSSYIAWSTNSELFRSIEQGQTCGDVNFNDPIYYFGVGASSEEKVFLGARVRVVEMGSTLEQKSYVLPGHELYDTISFGRSAGWNSLLHTVAAEYGGAPYEHGKIAEAYNRGACHHMYDGVGLIHALSENIAYDYFVVEVNDLEASGEHGYFGVFLHEISESAY